MSGKKNVRGQPAYAPNVKDRKIVEKCAAACFSLPVIADMIGVCSKTVERHYKKELNTSRGKGLLNVSADLYYLSSQRKGIASVTAAIWLEKTRGGLRETSVVEHAGPDGGALPQFKVVVAKLPDNGRGLPQLPAPKGRSPKMIDVTPIKSKESDDD